VFADIAAVFHWPLSAMDGMALHELMDWHKLAIERFKALKG
jgi:hypothetical protein